MMRQCINEERGKMSFMRMKPSLHSYLDNTYVLRATYKTTIDETMH
jgi:hypothetical protein